MASNDAGEEQSDGNGIEVLDVDSSRRSLQEEAMHAARRADLLSRITGELVGTLESEEAATRLSRLVVPALADWCVVTLTDDDKAARSRHGLRHAACWHVDPDMRAVVDKYAQARLDQFDDDSLLVRVMETGDALSFPGNAMESIEPMFMEGEAEDMIKLLAPESVMVLPLIGRNGPVGMLSLCNGAERGSFSSEDVITANHVASRVGLVLDNARLYRQQLELAEGLQRSLLTEPPEPDHAQVVVRYSPSAEAAQVGGDWYDAFMQPQGATVLVIGDVIGHDTQAAAAMGQIRSIVRTIGAVDDDSPATILRKADRVMQTLQVGTTATAVVSRLGQNADQFSRGITELQWSNAGHPPPMVINADATIFALNAPQADVLLGVAPDAQRRESKVVLDRGATVVMYTDGLIERRGQSIDVGLERLQTVLSELADTELNQLCDELLERMLPAEREDDVAIVALRLHRQDRPRPSEAGPRRVPPGVPARSFPAVDSKQGPI